MSMMKRLALIAAGYGLAVLSGTGAVAVNELLIPDDVAQGSPGMVAFGSAILFLLVAGFVGLVPSWFLLRLLAERWPRALLVGLMLLAGIGPLSWLAIIHLASGASPPNPPQANNALLGFFVAMIGIPRMVLGPVMILIEGATLLLLRERRMRALLSAAMLLDLVPLGLFALHMARAMHS